LEQAMTTVLAIAALAIVFPLVFRLADKLGESTGLVSALKKFHLL
jgi:hypothetical protein